MMPEDTVECGRRKLPLNAIGFPAKGAEMGGAAAVEMVPRPQATACIRAKIPSPAANALWVRPRTPATLPPIHGFQTENRHVRRIALLLASNIGSGIDHRLLPGGSS